MKNIQRLFSAAFLIMPAAAMAAGTDDWWKPLSAINSGDTAWVMTSAALVLFMTLPGLALFYGGMVRKKNLLSTMMHSFSAAALVSVLWMAIGYSLAFTPGNAFIGGLDRVFLSGMGLDLHKEIGTVSPNAGSIPETVFMFFQMTFAIISTAIITGAFAERMKYSAMMLFSGLWVLLVYVPTAHWVWGGGFMGEGGVLDYAGGTVVHINAGVAGLVAAIVLGKRIGYGKEAMPPHNMALTLMGAAMLWVGWFGFNAGSAVAADASAGMAMAVTQIAAAAAALTWLACEKISGHRPSALGLASGAVAGLVGITPAAGFVGPQGALAIGVLTAAGAFWASVILKRKLGYDDSLDAFGIHGFGGLIGATMLGLGADGVKWVGDGTKLDGVVGKVILPALASPFIAGFISMIGTWLVYRITRKVAEGYKERGFRWGQIGTASLVSLAHGTNDAQKTMGIIAMTLIGAEATGALDNLPSWLAFMHPDAHAGDGNAMWIVLTCAVVMAAGTASGGWKIIKTLGHKMVKLHPIHGFAAETSSATILTLYVLPALYYFVATHPKLARALH